MTTASSLMKSGVYKRALVIGADVLSKFTDWNDRGTCVLFGDGAGAVVLEADSNYKSGHRLLTIDLGADGTHTDILKIPDGGSRSPYDKNKNEFFPYIKMDGKEVYRHAVTRMIETATKALGKAGKKPEDLKLLIPHQANLRIIESIAKTNENTHG